MVDTNEHSVATVFDFSWEEYGALLVALPRKADLIG